MKASLVTAPTLEPITLDETKEHLRIEKSIHDEDSYLNSLIEMARRQVENITRRALMMQTWKFFLNSWPGTDYIELPKSPLLSVTSIKYKTSAEVETEFTNTYYLTDTDSTVGRVVLKYGQVWPTAILSPKNPIYIQYVCGYSAATVVSTARDAVPEPIRHAMKIMISGWYEQREPFIVGQNIQRYDDAANNLLMPYRIWGF